MKSQKARLSPLDLASLKMHGRANDVRIAARRALPLWARLPVLRKVDRIVVKLDGDALCKAARLVHKAIALYAAWTETEVDDQAAQLLDAVLDELGCKD